MTVTWQDITAITEARGGTRAWQDGSTRAWYFPSPTGGTFSAEVTLCPRWCSVAVDRIRTTDRDEARSQRWFEQHAWPLVDRALKARHKTRPRDRGFLPSGGGAFASASPLDRADVPGLLAAWIDAELGWGLPCDPEG